jgi:hypothetical protein
VAVSKVAIVNRALQKLGAKRIESLSQDHPNARSMNTAFEPVRNALFRRYKWNFAIKRESVAADADQTAWGELNRYALPADFARLIRDDETRVRSDWKIEGRYIVTDYASPLEFRYVAIIDDPTVYDPLFVELLSTVLAIETCEEITQSTSKLNSLEMRFKRDYADARQAGAFELDPEEALDDDWLIARE